VQVFIVATIAESSPPLILSKHFSISTRITQQ